MCRSSRKWSWWWCSAGATVSLALAGCQKPAIMTQPPPAGPVDGGGGVGDGRAGDAFVFNPVEAGVRGEVGLGPAQTGCSGAETTNPVPCASIGVALQPPYAMSYTCFDLGPAPGVPPQKYGGLTLTLERCSTTLLIGGEANYPEGKLYAIPVARDGNGRVSRFLDGTTIHADAPHNDGGVVFGPGGVLFLTGWPTNELLFIKPGSRTVDKVVDLTPLGIAGASAALNFVPPYLSAKGALKLVSWEGGEWYTLAFEPDASGTFNVTGARPGPSLPGGPEGFVYVAAGSPLIAAHSMLVSEWTEGAISIYETDDHGDPKLGTRKAFITGLVGAEGAFRDPDTGDFFFSTWGQEKDRVIVVRGFKPVIIE